MQKLAKHWSQQRAKNFHRWHMNPKLQSTVLFVTAAKQHSIQCLAAQMSCRKYVFFFSTQLQRSKKIKQLVVKKAASRVTQTKHHICLQTVPILAGHQTLENPYMEREESCIMARNLSFSRSTLLNGAQRTVNQALTAVTKTKNIDQRSAVFYVQVAIQKQKYQHNCPLVCQMLVSRKVVPDN